MSIKLYLYAVTLPRAAESDPPAYVFVESPTLYEVQDAAPSCIVKSVPDDHAPLVYQNHSIDIHRLPHDRAHVRKAASTAHRAARLARQQLQGLTP